MLSSVLRSKRAIEVNIVIMRVFVKLREMLTTHKELAQKLADLERRFEDHDEQFNIVFDAIRALMAPPENPGKRSVLRLKNLVLFMVKGQRGAGKRNAPFQGRRPDDAIVGGATFW